MAQVNTILGISLPLFVMIGGGKEHVKPDPAPMIAK
jgi:hypothetical protein